MIRYLERALWPTVAFVLLSACLCGCATIGQFPPGGRICHTDFPSDKDCDCEVFVLGSGWHHRNCPPSPTPSPSITPTPAPTPTPSPNPTPSPSPTSSPCTPQVVPFVCPAGTPQCWRCSERLEWELAHGNLEPLPGSTLLFNHPGGDVNRWEYVDRQCNFVRRDGSIIRTAEQQNGIACVDNQAVCPPDRLSPCPSPTPSTSPTPGPTPTPGTCLACSEIELCGIGAQVHQFQNRQAQTVPYHREGDGGFIYVPDGPVLGGKVQTDQTPYYKPKVNPPGGCGPKFSCNGEGEYWGKCCEKCEKPGVWSQVSGPHLDFDLYNNGFGLDARLTQPGYYEFKTCGSDQGQPNTCKLIAWRITQ